MPFPRSVNSAPSRHLPSGTDDAVTPGPAPERRRRTEPLSFGALRAIAAGVAWSPASPLGHHRGPAAPRSRRVLATDLYDVWLVTWPPASGSPFHSHGRVRSLIHLIEGELVEIFSDDGDALAAGSRLLRPGLVLRHRVPGPRSDQSGAAATTVHVYSPPLVNLTAVDPPPVEECDRLRAVAARHRFRQTGADRQPALRPPPLALLRRPRRARGPVVTGADTQPGPSASSATVSQASSASSSSTWVAARSVPSRFISS